MNDKNSIGNWETFMDFFAAELIIVAYPIAVRHGIGDVWDHLELDLWNVLTETVRSWREQTPWAEWPVEFDGWREDLLARLTDAAYRRTLEHGIRGSFLDLELDLFRAFHPLIDKIDHETIFTPALGRN